MCTAFLVYKMVPTAPMILFQNRDEFFNRDFEILNTWPDAPGIYAPKDIPSGGSWMGLTKTGRFVTLTNYRDPAHRKDVAPSRGMLVLDFLKSKASTTEFVEKLKPRLAEYNGFNLIFGLLDELYYFSSRLCELQKLEPGFYALSNADLNTPWPKVQSGLEKVKTMKLQNLPGNLKEIQEAGMKLLGNVEIASDERLPKTGLPLEWERGLSSIFIKMPEYGTVASSVLIASDNRQVHWLDRYFGPRHEGECSQQLICLDRSLGISNR